MEKKYNKALMTQYPRARGRAFVMKNMGDYVQSVASRQFVHPIDEYIEQEEADTYHSPNGLKTRLIMNGWFQWQAENWPPSDDILPLLVSMHISPLKKDLLMTPEGINFLKKNSPVGCRDYYTVELLESYDIPAYFSGCVTLTLGKDFKVNDNERDGFYFVDPHFDVPPLYEEVEGQPILNKEALDGFIEVYSKHAEVINDLASRYFFKVYLPTGRLDKDETVFRPYYKAACFYKVFSQLFSDEFLLTANYITHYKEVDMKNDSNQDLIDIAESFVKKYARAKMVVTSRIHSGLPCLGMETPVVFVADKEVVSQNSTFASPGRLGGLVDLFRTVSFNDGLLETTDDAFLAIKKFEVNSTFKNKDDWRLYADRLKKQLSAFMSDEFDEKDIDKIRRMYYKPE